MGIVNHRREEIGSGHERTLRIQAIDGRVVARTGIDEYRRIGEGDQVTQDLRQLGRPEFTRSAGSV